MRMTKPLWLLMKTEWKNEVGMRPSVSALLEWAMVTTVTSGTELAPRLTK